VFVALDAKYESRFWFNEDLPAVPDWKGAEKVCPGNNRDKKCPDIKKILAELATPKTPVPPAEPAPPAEPEFTKEELNQQLTQATASEDFERCVFLRDQLKALEDGQE
jgi:hypothetical protein